MKLILKNLDNITNEHLAITRQEVPCLDLSWHYHAQYELLYISKSFGIRYVGDSVSQFTAGDLVLVGPHLPHLWRNDPSYYKADDTNKVKTIVIKFTKDFIGESNFIRPEFSDINNLLEQSRFGVHFNEKVSNKLGPELMCILDSSPVQQIIKLLDLLSKLSVVQDRKLLSATDMRQFSTDHSQRLDTVIKYISDNYFNEIDLSEVSDIACMTTNSFCRFFKKMTNKSFTQFLNEVRIRNAARLLVQEDLPIVEICYKVGYQSITNFNMQFKQIMGTTPQNHRQTVK